MLDLLARFPCGVLAMSNSKGGGYLGKPIAIHRRRAQLASGAVLKRIAYRARFIVKKPRPPSPARVAL
jgi:hypothetical protein